MFRAAADDDDGAVSVESAIIHQGIVGDVKTEFPLTWGGNPEKYVQPQVETFQTQSQVEVVYLFYSLDYINT